MGASIGMGLGLRHVLPEDEARRVVSVLGDSTFVHSGITGLVEMAYNPPATGHVVLILDNSTTAMTGLQEHPGTGRTLDHQPTAKLSFEAIAKAIGLDYVVVVDPSREPERLEEVLRESLAATRLSLIISRRTCLLAAGKIKQYEQATAESRGRPMASEDGGSRNE
jgi:indolepyruvate ferredoxin oxidoreductase alpha subunit